MMCDFTMTACAIPELAAQTLESFSRNLRGVDMQSCRLYLNVDPLPEGGDVSAVAAVAGQHFADVVLNTPDRASFPVAVKWCFLQPTAANVIHLEYDWLLTEPVEIGQLLAVRYRHSLDVVNLRHRMDLGHHAGHAYLCPGLWRRDAMRKVAETMTGRKNPECHLWASGVVGKMHPPDRVVTHDIGRDWQAEHGWKKNAKGANWTCWHQSTS